MAALGLLVQPDLTPGTSLAWDRRLLADAPRTGALRVYALRGDVLSLGRFHLVPQARSVTLHRRHSGGRAMPSGDGFVGAALTLPHRSALASSDPLALAPEQVMNRCVRGLLEGLKLAGIPAFYPGRDLLTVEGRSIGFVSFEVDALGALLFETILAVERDFGLLPHLLDRADPEGVVKAEMLLPDDSTCVAHELGRPLPIDELARLFCRGYAAKFGVGFSEREASMPDPFPEDQWLRQRAPRADLDRHGTACTMLGSVDAHFALGADGTIADIVLAGDFIANSPAIDRLEGALRGCRPELSALDLVIERAFAAPEDFILGIGPLGTIAEAIVRGAAR